jgi:hypothetical protein
MPPPRASFVTVTTANAKIIARGARRRHTSVSASSGPVIRLTTSASGPGCSPNPN